MHESINTISIQVVDDTLDKATCMHGYYVENKDGK